MRNITGTTKTEGTAYGYHIFYIQQIQKIVSPDISQQNMVQLLENHPFVPFCSNGSAVMEAEALQENKHFKQIHHV